MIELIVQGALDFYKQMDKRYKPPIRVETHAGGEAEFWLVYLDDRRILSICPRKEKVSVIFWLGNFAFQQSFYQNIQKVQEEIAFVLACHIYMYKHVLPILEDFQHLVYQIDYRYNIPLGEGFYVEATIWDKVNDWLLFLDFDRWGCIHYNFVHEQGALAGIWTPQARSKVYTHLKSLLFNRI